MQKLDQHTFVLFCATGYEVVMSVSAASGYHTAFPVEIRFVVVNYM